MNIHSHLPWVAIQSAYTSRVRVWSDDGTAVAIVYVNDKQRGNGELIITAVNTYHKHLEDIAKLRKALEALVGTQGKLVSGNYVLTKDDLEAARAALRETDQ